MQFFNCSCIIVQYFPILYSNVTYNNALKYICPCLAPALYTLDPPLETAISRRLNDTNNDTCLALAEVDHYTFDASTGDWLPHPRNECWFPGLAIDISVPGGMTTSLTVTITGHHLKCSTSDFQVTMRSTAWEGCGLTGLYRICEWSGAVESAGLTTCVAMCLCEGNDCTHVIVRIPRVYEEWEICEIDIN